MEKEIAQCGAPCKYFVFMTYTLMSIIYFPFVHMCHKN